MSGIVHLSLGLCVIERVSKCLGHRLVEGFWN